MNNEKKLLWMCDALEKVVVHMNTKYPDFHLFTMVDVGYDGETWQGKIHPFFMADTGMTMADRLMIVRYYRTDTLRELINQMMADVEHQDGVLEKQIKEAGEFYGE